MYFAGGWYFQALKYDGSLELSFSVGLGFKFYDLNLIILSNYRTLLNNYLCSHIDMIDLNKAGPF